MPEYVYALYDFLPEHDNEVEFHAGERIEFVEKDDLHGDGWWQVRIHPLFFFTFETIQVLARVFSAIFDAQEPGVRRTNSMAEYPEHRAVQIGAARVDWS